MEDATVNVSLSGLWFAAWLFTVGYAKLGFFWGVFALLLWPYLLGQAVAH